jgi:hypothetical protein
MPSPELDRLTASTTAEITVGDSMAVLLGTLSEIIRNTAPTAAALSALADTVDAKTAEWTAAVIANTPAA